METSEDHPATQENEASGVASFGVAASLLAVFSACGGIIGGYGQISIGNANGWWLLVGDQNDPSYSTYGYVLLPLMIASVVVMVIFGAIAGAAIGAIGTKVASWFLGKR